MKDGPEGRMIALVGDAEMDEGNIFEALLEGWKQGLRNTWWIVDYNRQSLDANVREGHEWDPFEGLTASTEALQAYLDRTPFAQDNHRRLTGAAVPVPETLAITPQPVTSTQMGFGQLLNEIGRDDSALARRIV